MKRPKEFKLQPEQIRRLVPKMGSCIASARITVDGQRVGSMVREAADYPEDSGWRFFAGDETQDYLDNPDNLTIFALNTQRRRSSSRRQTRNRMRQLPDCPRVCASCRGAIG